MTSSSATGLARRRSARLAHWSIVGLLLALAACGKKGPPLAPLRVAPARVEDLAVQRSGDHVRARFTVPVENDNKTKPADIAAIELYAISGKPEDPSGQPLNGPDFLRFADFIGRIEVMPPPEEEGAPAAPAPAEAGKPDAGPAQGEFGFITETLTPAARQPFVHPRRRETRPVDEPPTEVRPLTGPPPDLPFSRVYVATAISRKGNRSAVSNRVALPLDDLAVSPPAKVTVQFSERSLGLSWALPPDAALPAQREATGTELAARPLVSSRILTTYNVYVVTRTDDATAESPEPLNPVPVTVGAFSIPLSGFGTEHCFVVRAVKHYGRARVESPASPLTCAVPVDRFPPAAPKGLIAVGSEGGVSLIWDTNSEPDLDGYIVMRGEAGPGGATATLTPLMAEPLKETTYRDTTARAGVRYVYAVVAVDNASPRNVSPESNRVEEGVR